MPDEKQSQESQPLNSGGPLSGRVGVVTGAGSGLGRGISLFMIEAGATVVEQTSSKTIIHRWTLGLWRLRCRFSVSRRFFFWLASDEHFLC